MILHNSKLKHIHIYRYTGNANTKGRQLNFQSLLVDVNDAKRQEDGPFCFPKTFYLKIYVLFKVATRCWSQIHLPKQLILACQERQLSVLFYCKKIIGKNKNKKTIFHSTSLSISASILTLASCGCSSF